MLDLLQNVAIYIIPFLVILGVVVTVHELGHFLVAKWLGTKIDEFSIGFGHPIARWRDRDGVDWRLGWLPLGGYVRFAGDDNAASVPDADDLDALRRDLTAREGEGALNRYFHFKPIWQRAAITAAGPAANFLLAMVIFAGLLFFLGQPVSPARVEGVKPGSPAARAGLQAGDVVLRANGEEIESSDELNRIVVLRTGVPIDLVVDRGGETLSLTATPERGVIIDSLGKPQKLGVLGLITPARVDDVRAGSPAARAGFQVGDIVQRANGEDIENFQHLQRIVSVRAGVPIDFVVQRGAGVVALIATPELAASADTSADSSRRAVLGLASGGRRTSEVQLKRYGPLEAVAGGVERTVGVVTMTVHYLGRMITGRENADQLSGPLGMAQLSGDVAKRTAEVSQSPGALALNTLITTLELIANISVGIGFLNLLPIPILDGGHLLFYGYEAVARRPLAAKVQAAGYRVGLALVLGLMLFATWNDLQRLHVFNLFGRLFS